MIKNPNFYLTHILDSIQLIEKYLEGVTEEIFNSSDEKQDLVIRRLEIIGEAAKHLPEQYKKEHPDIPWRDIGDMRNVLIHEYFDVDKKIVWKTATKLVPQLKKQIIDLLKNTESK